MIWYQVIITKQCYLDCKNNNKHIQFKTIKVIWYYTELLQLYKKSVGYKNILIMIIILLARKSIFMVNYYRYIFNIKLCTIINNLFENMAIHKIYHVPKQNLNSSGKTKTIHSMMQDGNGALEVMGDSPLFPISL